MGIIESLTSTVRGLFTNNSSSNKKTGVAVYQYGSRNSYNTLGKIENMKYPIATSYLFSPIFGQPRKVNMYSIRTLSKSNWVRMFINVIIKTIVNTEWSIIPIDGEEKNITDKATFEAVKDFFDHPSTNGEDINYFNEVLTHDFLEVGEMMLALVYNESLYEKKSFSLEQQDWSITESITKKVASYDISKTGTTKKSYEIKSLIKNKICKGVTKKGGLIDIRAIDPASVNVDIDKFGDLPTDKPAYFQYMWRNANLMTPKPFFKREIIWEKNNPTSYETYGQSPLISVMMILETLISGVRDNKLLFENGASPDGVLSIMSDSSEQATKVANILKNKIKNNPHKVVVTNEDHKFTSMRLTNQDLQWLDGSKFFKDLIGAMYNVPPDELGFTENSNRATTIGQNKVFVRNSVFPQLSKLKGVWNKVIDTFYPDGMSRECEFKFFYKDLDLIKAQKEMDWGDLDRKVKSINEVRIASGDEEVAWGDDPTELADSMNPLSAGNVKNDVYDDKEKVKENEREDKGFSYALVSKAVVKSDRPTEKLYGMLDSYLAKNFNHLIKEFNVIINKGLSQEETIFEINRLIDGVGGFQLDGLNNSISGLYDLGVDNVEKMTNQNLGVLMNKSSVVDVFGQQIMYGYTLPSGQKWKGFQGLSDDLKNSVVDKIVSSTVAGKGVNVIASEISSLTGVYKNHALMIARTETSRILHGVELTGIAKAGLKVKKQWLAHFDDRTGDDSKRLNGQVVAFNENFVDPKTGAKFFSPPHRPNDRCTLIYITEGTSKGFSSSFNKMIKVV